MTPPPEWRSLYPFDSHLLRLNGGVGYHYLDEAPRQPVGNQPLDTLLLVHGNPTWSFYWRELVRAWRTRHRVVVPDHVGCGLSDKPADYNYRLAQHVDNLRQLIHELDLRHITLVAHDWGGAIGMGAAVAEPDRFARLVLLNTAAFRSSRMPWRIGACRLPLVGRLAVQGLNAFARAALVMATEKPERLTPQVRAGLLAPYDSWQHRQAIYRFVQDIPLHASHPSYQRLTEIEQGLPRVGHLPALLVWGMRDWCFTPHFLERFRQLLPHAEVVPIEDAGHYVVEDAWERIGPLVETFIDRHPAHSEPRDG